MGKQIIIEIERYRRSQGSLGALDRSGGERQFAIRVLWEYLIGWEEDREEMEMYLKSERKGRLWDVLMAILGIDRYEGAEILLKFLKEKDGKET